MCSYSSRWCSMTDKTWKALERRIAENLGTVRTPLSGGNSRHTTSDTLHPSLYVECKQRRVSALHTLFQKVRTEATKESKNPVLVIHLESAHNSEAVIDWDFFVKLWETYVITHNAESPIGESNP